MGLFIELTVDVNLNHEKLLHEFIRMKHFRIVNFISHYGPYFTFKMAGVINWHSTHKKMSGIIFSIIHLSIGRYWETPTKWLTSGRFSYSKTNVVLGQYLSRIL